MTQCRHTVILATAFIMMVSPIIAAGEVNDVEEGGKPLPRYRLGPDGRNATPAPDPGQPMTPYAIELPRAQSSPDTCLVTSPPEYAAIEGVLFQYTSGQWNEIVTDLVASLTGDPAHDEIAYVVVSNSTQQTYAETEFTAAGADLSKVEFIIKPTNALWIRDYGPHFITQGGAQAIVDSHYYPQRPQDNFIPTLLADDYFISPSYDIGLYYSGGNFQPAANRHGFVTALIHADNPGFGEPFIAALYDEYQGIDTLHVMPQLPGSVDGTGHIDMWFYLVDEDTVIISEFETGSNPDAITITDNAVPYMEALGYEVIRVPAWNVGNTHYTYTNAFRVNDRIFVPTYGDGDRKYRKNDTAALDAWQLAAGPGVEIIPINCYDIIWAAGAIHCIVMQVPRYTDPLPSACTTSPRGGELLVPGTEHEITWTATDDTLIDTVDLHYSLDGGLTWPAEQTIATGLSDTGRHTWLVPEVESGEARVKTVAWDDIGNPVEAESETDAAIQTAARHVYDFATGAGVDRHVFGYQTSSWSELDGIRLPAGVATELTAGEYAALAVSDATGGDSDTNRYISATPGFSSESTHVLEFTIAESPADIVDIGISWEGYVDDCTQMELYVWDHVAAQWCDGAGTCGENRFLDNFAGNRDDNVGGHIRGDFDRYIDGSGVMTLLLYAERNGDRSFHDHVAVTITHEPCGGVDIDFDGYADGCDNCPMTANPGQENGDGDALGDACDCAAADGTVFAAPLEILNLSVLDDKNTLAWDSDAPNSGPGTTYDVARGDVGDYPVGAGAGESCAGTGLDTTTLVGIPDPPADGGHYYLVRGTNSCATGTYGFDSGMAERVTSACP